MAIKLHSALQDIQSVLPKPPLQSPQEDKLVYKGQLPFLRMQETSFDLSVILIKDGLIN